MLRTVLGCLLVASFALAVGAEDPDMDDGLAYDDEGRLLVVTVGSGTGGGGLNISSIVGGLLSAIFNPFNLNITGGAAPYLIPLLLSLASLGAATAISIAVPLGVLHHHGYCGYGSGSGSGYGSGSGSDSSYGNSGGYSSYSSYRR